MKITDLPNELLNEMIMKMSPKAASRLMVASKDINDSIGGREKEALYWLILEGPRAFIPYMSHLNKSYSEMQPKQKRTAKLLILSYPTPEALVFHALKIYNSLASIKILEQVLGRDIIEDKLRLIKKQLELYPDKYPGIIRAKLDQYGDLAIEPLSERFKNLKVNLGDLEIIGDQAIKHRIHESNVDDINSLMKESPLYNIKLLKILTEFGGDVDFAISEATRDPIMMKYLIQNGAEVINYRDTKRNSPLHWAAKRGNKEVVKLLLEHGADIGATTYHGEASLHMAVRYGNKGVVELLLEHGAKVDTASSNGRTLLHYASEYGHKEIAKLLIERGAKVEAVAYQGWTPLHYAAIEGKKQICELLIEHGATIDAKNIYGKTPLHFAAEKCNKDVVGLLLDRGAHVNAIFHYHGWTPLHLAAKYGHKQIAELLVERGAKVNAADNSGWTPIHWAAEEGKNDVVEFLLYRGANANFADID